jgi:aminopeptidase N
MGKNVTRLYEQFQPENYKLHLLPDADELKFRGTVTIKGKKTGRPSERITFHQKELTVTSAKIVKHNKDGDNEIAVARINNHDKYDEVRLHADEMVYPGEYTVTMEFEGDVTKPMLGIYPCFFKHDEKEKKLIATQFESHHAREAFPCIDEPEAKATFDLTLTTPSSDTVLGNTPIKKQLIREGNHVTTFETTPRMSTYLLAFVFGELEYKEAKTKDGVEIRTFATPDNIDLTDFGLSVAVRCLEFFSDYFGVAYPLPKLDMVALPDFASGAMENWGLVTYREVAMLVDEKHSSIESKQMVALVICHELSHQWFGNLVTMKWWDDLWLNESFANMMEYRVVDALFPEWKIWEQFVSHEGVSAKRRDSLADVQSVHQQVNHPDEISTLFDPSIVYAKGGTILYMLLNYIGEEAFRSGLRKYFKKHAYGNTVANDLWEALSEASGENISAFMHKWLTKAGYPLVTIDWKPGESEVKLSQKRFLSDPNAPNDDEAPWHTPLVSTLPLSVASLNKNDATVNLESASSEPFVLNHDGQSYFLPYYKNPEHLQQIKDGISSGSVSAIDRFILLDTYIMLQRGGITETTALLELLSSYENEPSEIVWSALSMSIGEAKKLIEGDEKSNDRLNKVLAGLCLEIAEKLGWDDKPGDSSQTLMLRGIAMSLAASTKSQSVIDEGLKRFRQFETPSDLSPSTRAIVYFCGVRYGNDADFDKLLNLYKTRHNAEERDEIAGGLTSVQDPSHIKQVVDLLKSDVIRRQDMMHWYVWLLRNHYSRAATWEWLVTNWEWITEQFSKDKSYSNFARYCGSIFSTRAEFEQFNDFFEDKKSIIAMTRDISLAQQEIGARVSWRNRNETLVKDWLKKNA